MKSRIVQSPAYEDSGVAISGELGEPSFSGECEGIVSLRAPKEIEEDANPDPRFEYIKYCNKLLNDRGVLQFRVKIKEIKLYLKYLS